MTDGYEASYREQYQSPQPVSRVPAPIPAANESPREAQDLIYEWSNGEEGRACLRPCGARLVLLAGAILVIADSTTNALHTAISKRKRSLVMFFGKGNQKLLC